MRVPLANRRFWIQHFQRKLQCGTNGTNFINMKEMSTSDRISMHWDHPKQQANFFLFKLLQMFSFYHMIATCLFSHEVQAAVLQKNCRLNMSLQKQKNKRDEDITSIRPFIYSFAWTVNQQEDKRMLHLNGESNHLSLHVSMVIVRTNVWLMDISFIVLYKAETKRQSFFILSFHLYLSPEKWFIR